eukprot:GHVQ01034176.1.p1 GENE.GHVQ01034176.1~~GHVQ01034176.1.p1  ORF type:complete len:620 (+),score=76.82 GHVQ01034176.1:1097-2956(+)
MTVDGFRSRIDRNNVPDVDNPMGYGNSPISITNKTEHQVLRAVGQRRLKGFTLQAMADDMIPRVIQRKLIAAIGKAHLLEALYKIVYDFSPGKAFVLEILTDVWPVLKFVKPYKNLTLRVPRPPRPEGLFFNRICEDYAQEYSRVYRLKHPRAAKWNDHVELKVLRGWTVHKNGTREQISQDLLPEQHLNVTLVEEVEWTENPPGMCDALLGIKRGDKRAIPLELVSESLLNDTMQAIPVSGKALSDTVAKAGPFSLKTTERFSMDSLYNRMDEDEPGQKNVSPIPVRNSTSMVTGGENDQEDGFRSIIDLQCLRVRGRKPAVIDDEFFKRELNTTREEMYQAIEHDSACLIEERAHEGRRGAVAEKLEHCCRIVFPETLVEQHGRVMFTAYIDNRKREGEDIKGMDAEEYYQGWRITNFDKITRELSSAFTVQSIREIEGLVVDKDEVFQDAEEILKKYPSANTTAVAIGAYRAKESSLVYDWVTQNSKIEYYVDEKPLRVTVDPYSSTGKSANRCSAYAAGVDPDKYEAKEKKESMDADKIRNFANSLAPVNKRLESENNEQIKHMQSRLGPITGNSSDEEEEDVIRVVKESKMAQHVAERERKLEANRRAAELNEH